MLCRRQRRVVDQRCVTSVWRQKTALEELASRTLWTSTVVMKPLVSLSNLWKRFLYLWHTLLINSVYINRSVTAERKQNIQVPDYFLVVQIDLRCLCELLRTRPVAHLMVQKLLGCFQLLLDVLFNEKVN